MNPLDHAVLNATVNTVAGNHPTHPYFQRQTAVTAATNQIKYIREEVEELSAGIAEDNITEIRDGLGDSIVTLDGLMHRLGLSYNDFETIRDILKASIESKGVLTWSDYLKNAFGSLSEAVTALGRADDTVRHDETNQRLIEVSTAARWLLSMLYEIADAYQIDVMADQREIYKSNMSKFDTDHMVALVGRDRYRAERGIEVTIVASEYEGQTYYVLKSPLDQKDNKGRLVPAGKFLKSVNFKEPVLS